jgi:alkanesulfonate monooxygenase
MPVEFLGMIATQHASEIHGLDGPLVDPDYVTRFARAHEDSGFDRVLIGYSSASPDGLQVAAYAATRTERLGFLVAHRPGFLAPTVAARAFATLDQFSRGRVALHTISGGSDAEQRRDGDHLDKPGRYRRSREFLQIIKRAWTESEPFSYDGEFYKLEDFVSHVRPYQQPRIPIYFGGSSPVAYEVGGAEADVFALFAQPVEQIAEEISAIHAAAAAAGRATPPRISVSFRPITAATDELAWERAHRILDTTTERIASGEGIRGWRRTRPGPSSTGSQRQLAVAAKAERHGKALWTPLAQATGAPGNSTALVGSPETVAEALLEYVDAGVSTILIRGFDPFDDAIAYRDVIEIVRQEVARRELHDGAGDSAPVGVGA